MLHNMHTIHVQNSRCCRTTYCLLIHRDTNTKGNCKLLSKTENKEQNNRKKKVYCTVSDEYTITQATLWPVHPTVFWQQVWPMWKKKKKKLLRQGDEMYYKTLTATKEKKYLKILTTMCYLQGCTTQLISENFTYPMMKLAQSSWSK